MLDAVHMRLFAAQSQIAEEALFAMLCAK